MKFMTAAVSALALSLGAGAAMAACDEGEIVVKFSHVTNTDKHPKGIAASLLQKRVNEEMDGKMCMEVFPHLDDAIRVFVMPNRCAMKEAVDVRADKCCRCCERHWKCRPKGAQLPGPRPAHSAMPRVVGAARIGFPAPLGPGSQRRSLLRWRPLLHSQPRRDQHVAT